MSRRANNEGTIYKRADGRWAGVLHLGYEGGRRRRKAFYGKTRQAVAQKLAAALRAQHQGLPVAGERETVGAFLERWLEESARPVLRPRTFASYAMIARQHLTPDLGRTPLAKLGPEAIQRYMNSKRASGLSARTVAYHHAVLRRALGQAEKWGKISRNPARLVSPPRAQRPEVRPLTPEQARVFLGACAGDRQEPLYLLAFGLGLRQGELLGLTWPDVDLEAGTLTVRHTLQRYGGAYHLDEPKTERSRRTIPLTTGLVAVLRAHRVRQLEERLRAGSEWKGDGWGLVFATECGHPVSGARLTQRFQGVLNAVGLPRQPFHNVRHAAASFMLSEGVALRTIMEVLGHSQIAVTANLYGHVAPAAQQDALERVGSLLESRS